MDSSDGKRSYVAATTIKLKPSRAVSSSALCKQRELPSLRRHRSSSVILEDAGRPSPATQPTEVQAKVSHTSSVSIALRKGAAGRASSEPRHRDESERLQGGRVFSEGVDNRSEAVPNYRQTSRQASERPHEEAFGSSETEIVATLDKETSLEVNRDTAHSREGRGGANCVETGTNTIDKRQPAIVQQGVVVSRRRVNVDQTRGEYRRWNSDPTFVVSTPSLLSPPPERENGTNTTRPRSAEGHFEKLEEEVESGNVQVQRGSPEDHAVGVGGQPVVVLNKTALGKRCATSSSSDGDNILGDRSIAIDQSEVKEKLSLAPEGAGEQLLPSDEHQQEVAGFSEEMMHRYHALEASLLSERGLVARDSDQEAVGRDTMPTEKTGNLRVESVSPSSDVVDSDGGTEFHRVGPQSEHAPDVHLYNDQNGRLHVVVDASKFSSSLSPNVVSGMKATVSDSSIGEILSSQELADSTHITLRRRSSMYHAMENSVMPSARRAALQRRRAERAARERILEEGRHSDSPQLPAETPPTKTGIRRAQSVEVLAVNIPEAVPGSPIVRMRAGSDRTHRRPLSAIFSSEGVEDRRAKPNRNSIACQAEIQLTDLSSSCQRSALTISVPGGNRVILRPPVKSKRDLTDEDMRQHVLMNLVETEISYVRSLQTLIKVYFEPLKKPRTPTLIDAGQVDVIFYQIPNLQSCHESFLQQLTDRVSDWHNQQKIGDIFVNQFSKCMLSDAYAAFINHYLQAKEAVRSAASQRPAFSKFLEHCSREHSDKLTLNDLLIQPVQRIPRYVLLLKDMLKHTPQEHPDHNHLQSAVSELTTLAENMDQGEWEAAEAEKLKELESSFEGHVLFAEARRYVLCQDTVGQVLDDEQIKERSLILLSDFVICSTIRRSRGSTFKRRGSSLFSLGLSPSHQLFEIKHKLLWKASFSDIILIKSLEASVPIPYTSLVLPPSLAAFSSRRPSVTEKSTVEKLHHDSACLQQITTLVKQLYVHHAQLETALRELETEVKDQIEIQKQTDYQLSRVKARLGIILQTSSGESVTYTLQFSSEQRKKAWIEEFEEAKKKRLAAEDSSVTWNAPATVGCFTGRSDSNSVSSKRDAFIPPKPQFHKPIPLMKTRSGMRISCAATSVSPMTSPHGSFGAGNLWICASDGCVGQVGIVTVEAVSPHEMVCITVCACRITCIVPVPEMSPSDTSLTERRESTVGPLRKLSTDSTVQRSLSSSADLVRERGRIPVMVRRSHSFGDRARSSSQPTLSQHVDAHALRFYSLTSASSFMSLYAQRKGGMFEQLSTLPGPESEACLYPETAGSDIRSYSAIDIPSHHEPSPVSSSGSVYSTPVNSPARALGRPVRGGSPADGTISHTEIVQESEVARTGASKNTDPHRLKGSTMWLGTEEGSVLVYHASDSIRVRQQRTKMEFGIPVVAISYMKDQVFVSLEGGVMYAVSRAPGGSWDIDRKEQVIVGDGHTSITCMKPVLDLLWCGSGPVVHVVSPTTLKAEKHFQAHSEQVKVVTHIVSAGLTAWLAFEKSSEVKLFNAVTLQQLAAVDVRPEVKRILQGSNGIVRQHKISQLRVTCLQPCEGLLWIGTSAGAMLTLRMPVIDEDTASVLELPALSSSYHGHTGLVRFVSAIRKLGGDRRQQHADIDWTQQDVDGGSTYSIPRSVSQSRLQKSKLVDGTEDVCSVNLNHIHTRTPSDASQSAISNSTVFSGSTIFSEPEAPTDQRTVVVSGGDGFEDFRTSGDDQVVGRDDSTSHILTWLV